MERPGQQSSSFSSILTDPRPPSGGGQDVLDPMRDRAGFVKHMVDVGVRTAQHFRVASTSRIPRADPVSQDQRASRSDALVACRLVLHAADGCEG